MTNIVQNEWQYGLCECYRNPGICCKVYCCGPCVICNNGEAVEKDGCVWCLISCCLPDVAAALFRSSAREKYGIEGDECEDWVSVTSLSAHCLHSQDCLLRPLAASALPVSSVRPLPSTRREDRLGWPTTKLHHFLCVKTFQLFLNISK